jgi:hypothetical protein
MASMEAIELAAATAAKAAEVCGIMSLPLMGEMLEEDGGPDKLAMLLLLTCIDVIWPAPGPLPAGSRPTTESRLTRLEPERPEVM